MSEKNCSNFQTTKSFFFGPSGNIFSNGLLKPLFVSPEEYFFTLFRIILLQFSVGRRAKQFGFCQRTSRPFVKSAFSSSIVTLQAASDEKLQNSKEKISRIFRQWYFNTGVETGNNMLRRKIVEESLLFLKKSKSEELCWH